MEGMFVKMWDPPTENPDTPDLITPTNPVPEVMAAAGLAAAPSDPHTMELDLLHGMAVPTWDGAKIMQFYSVINPDVPLSAQGTYPGSTVRMPCSVIFACATSGKGPPPHTIHWHGMEPTPMNDGVGHCSMEIGNYVYQWQPTFIGTYFYHCHRNTMQHFEFGLFGLLLVEPADAYFATLADPTIPIGHCRDGKRRTGANLANFPQFPGWKGGDRSAPDPWTGNPALKFATDPHAMTVPYDVEWLWVFDDRDSRWSDLAPGAHTGYPRHGAHPGYDDNFARNPGAQGFLAFNDYNADYWYVTGVPVQAHKGGTADIPPGIVVPAELNSGISGSQVSVEAFVGQTILLRVLDAAYNNCRYTFPVDIVIIEWDGRPLGVPPYGFNEAYLVPAGTPIYVAVGRRFGALIRENAPIRSFAVCEFIDTRGAEIPGQEVVTCTVRVPINISPVTPVAATADGIKINGGAVVTNKRQVTLSLSATSTAGAVTQMQFSKDGGAFTPLEPFAATRVVTLTAGDGIKTITVRFKDEAGNVSLPATATISLDTVAPNGTVTINGGAAFTNNRKVTLSLTAAVDTTQMQFSQNGTTFFPFEPFAASRVVTLPAGNGLKTITVRFKDAAGNVSAPVSDSITLDAALATGTIAFVGETTTAKSAVVNLTALSGVTQMQFSKNGGATYFPWEPFAATRTVTLPIIGVNTLFVRFKDAAGNVSAPVSDSITRN
jgi:hypothetical protein